MSSQADTITRHQRTPEPGAAPSKAGKGWPARPAQIPPALFFLASPIPASDVIGGFLPVMAGPRA